MSNEKKERVMTPKGFLHKSTTKAANSALAFLNQHRQWLLTGELAKTTMPILAKVDSGEIMPTPALPLIQKAVMDHMHEESKRKGEESMRRAEEVTPANWTATILNAKGEVCTRINAKGETEDLIMGFEKSNDADRWCDRRLVEGAPDWYGVVQHATMKNKDGDPISTVILRNDAMARVLATSKGPVMKQTSKSAGALSFRPKARPDHFHFSKG